MNTTAFALVMAILVIVIVGMILSMIRWIMQNSITTLRETAKLQETKLEEMRQAIAQIAASKRLSTYLLIERKSGIPLSLEQFQANKTALEARMLEELDEQIKRENTKSNPSHAAYNILSRSNLEDFVDHKTSQGVDLALGRLITNNDIDGARQFIRDTIAAL